MKSIDKYRKHIEKHMAGSENSPGKDPYESRHNFCNPLNKPTGSFFSDRYPLGHSTGTPLDNRPCWIRSNFCNRSENPTSIYFPFFSTGTPWTTDQVPSSKPFHLALFYMHLGKKSVGKALEKHLRILGKAMENIEKYKKSSGKSQDKHWKTCDMHTRTIWKTMKVARKSIEKHRKRLEHPVINALRNA